MTRAARDTTAARRSARTCATAVAALLTLGLLAACSGDETPPADTRSTTAAPPEETTTSPAPTPSEPAAEKPERPAAMDKKDVDGAATTTGYFLSPRPYIMATGDTAEWEAMSFKTCGFCASGLEQAEQIADREDRFSGGDVEAHVSKSYQQDEATGIWPVDVQVDEASSTITDSNGKKLFTSDQKSFVSRVEVGRIDNQWVIVEIASSPEDGPWRPGTDLSQFCWRRSRRRRSRLIHLSRRTPGHRRSKPQHRKIRRIPTCTLTRRSSRST